MLVPEVLELVAKGRSNREITRQLRLSEATVKTHLIHISDKLGASDLAHAVSAPSFQGGHESGLLVLRCAIILRISSI